MSQLNQNTTDLDALIAKANALPDAGAGGGGGGGSVETCTVNIQISGGAKLYVYSYIYLDSNGKITTSYVDLGTTPITTNLQLDKVVCNSLLYISWKANSYYSYADYSEYFETDFYAHWKVCSINGAIDTIYCIDDD